MREYEVLVGVVLRYRTTADAAIDVRRYVDGPGRAELEDQLGERLFAGPDIVGLSVVPVDAPADVDAEAVPG